MITHIHFMENNYVESKCGVDYFLRKLVGDDDGDDDGKKQFVVLYM